MLWLILGVLGPFYLFAPIVVWATQRLPVIPMRRVPRGEVPEPLAPVIAEWEAELGSTGLALVAIHQSTLGSGSPHWTPAHAGHVLHFADPRRGLHGLQYLTSAGRWRVFVTELANGEEVATGSMPSGDIFARDPRVHGVRAPATYDLRRLYALHLAHLEHVVRPGAFGVMREGPALLEMVPERERDFMERQHAHGELVGKGDVYRPTLRSAFLWTWRMLPPLAQIRGMRHARLRRTLEAAMGDDTRRE